MGRPAAYRGSGQLVAVVESQAAKLSRRESPDRLAPTKLLHSWVMASTWALVYSVVGWLGLWGECLPKFAAGSGIGSGADPSKIRHAAFWLTICPVGVCNLSGRGSFSRSCTSEFRFSEGFNPASRKRTWASRAVAMAAETGINSISLTGVGLALRLLLTAANCSRLRLSSSPKNWPLAFVRAIGLFEEQPTLKPAGAGC